MKKILVVDDIAEYAMVMEMYYPDGYEAISAHSLEEAKAQFAEHDNIPLAIVDVRLNEKDTSDISGMELLTWIKEKYPVTEVVMISAYKGSEYEMEALGRGAYCFLGKPLQPAQIRTVLGELL